MKPIQLNRQFKNPNIDEDDYSYLLTETSKRATFGWDEVLKEKLVVVLASASSGKTFEFREQSKKLLEKGYTSFFFAIEDVAEEPIEDLLTQTEFQQFQKWKSEQAYGYFFLDSVDEAKLKSKSAYRKALRRVAKFIGDGFDRAHIYISCRPSDWKKKEDEPETIKIFHKGKAEIIEENEELPPPKNKSRDEVWEIIREKVSREKIPNPEQSADNISTANTKNLSVYHLAPLNEERQRHLVKLASNVSNIDAFMQEIENRGLEPFAKRPGDILDLAEYWNAKGTFGTLAQMTEFGINKLLNEEETGREDSAQLSSSKAREGAERLAIALILSKRLSILKPGETSRDNDEVPISAREILNDWTDTQIDTLLRRGIFAPASFNAIRFQHRSTIEFLSATWFKNKIESPQFRKQVEDIIFRSAFNVNSISKELRPVVAWLALWDDKTRDEVLKREPFELIRHGDPKSLSIPFRQKLLSNYTEASINGNVADETVERRAIWSLSDPLLADTIRECWVKNSEYKFRSFLIDLIAEGKINACKDLVIQQANIDEKVGVYRLSAIRCLQDLEASEDLKTLAEEILKENLLTNESISIQSSIIEELFPEYISLNQLFDVIENTEALPESSDNPYGWRLPTLFEKCPIDKHNEFLHKINNLVIMQPHKRDYQPFSEKYGYLARNFRKLAKIAINIIQKPEDSVELAKTIVLGTMSDQDGFTPRFEKSLTDTVRENTALSRQCFVQDVMLHTLLEKDIDFKKTPWRMFSGIFKPTIWKFSETDINWLTQQVDDISNSEHLRQASYYTLLSTCGTLEKTQKYDKLLTRLSALNENCRHWLKLSKKSKKPNPRILQLERKRKVKKALNAKQEDGWADSWLKFKDAMEKSKPEPDFTNGISDDSRWLIYGCAQWLRMGNQNSMDKAMRLWRGLENVFGEDIPLRYAEHMKCLWRETKPERPVWNGKNCTKKWRSIHSFAGIGIEADSNPNWLDDLIDTEYKRVCGHLFLGEHTIPDWFIPLLKNRPDISVPMLRKEFVKEWKNVDSLIHRFLSYFSHDDNEMPPEVKNAILSVIVNNVPGNIDAWSLASRAVKKMELSDSQKKRLLTIVKKRIEETNSPISMLVPLFEILFWLAPDAGFKMVSAELKNADKERAEQIFGSLFSSFLNGRNVTSIKHTPIAIISELVDLAFEHVKLEEDEERPLGVNNDTVRLQAQDARNSLLNMLLGHPSEAAYMAMRTLAQRDDFGINEVWFNVLSKRMAERELEFKPWSSEQILEFHSAGTLPIQTIDQFFNLVLSTLNEIQNEFDNEDFSDRDLVQKAKIEAEVRDWLGKELRIRIGKYATSVKEAEVHDAKKPDIIVTSRDLGDEVVIELKHSDQGYTISDLTKTLNNQILKKYLKVERRRHGILYVSHHERSYWVDNKINQRVDFDYVSKLLDQKAKTISTTTTPPVKIRMFGLETGALEAKNKLRKKLKERENKKSKPQ